VCYQIPCLPKKADILPLERIAGSEWQVAGGLPVRRVFSYLEKKTMLELSHKKLIAWQKAIQLLPLVCEVRELPKEENYNIISQMKRAGLSVSSNLAEGASRKTKSDKKGFLKSYVLLLWN